VHFNLGELAEDRDAVLSQAEKHRDEYLPGLQVDQLAGQRPFHVRQSLNEGANIVCRVKGPAVPIGQLRVEAK
jgi:hypothetical protein